MKRIVLFVLTNVAVLVVLSIVLRVFGLDRALAQEGLAVGPLLAFSAAVGFTGAIISLLMSKQMAKWSTGAQVIDGTESADHAWLVQTVRQLAERAGIGMPEVAVYEGEPNAFATGAFKNSALVAVSTGLLQSMNREEVGAVLGHEVAHIANGDMVTMTLLQGVVNTFVIFLSRVIGHLVDRVVFRTERGHGPAFWVTAIIAELVLGILASLVVMWFSRQREFRADRGGASLTSPGQMIAALERLKASVDQPHLPDQMAAFGVSGRVGGGLARLFMTHPPLDERIAALRALQG